MTGDKQHDATTEFNEALAAGFAAGDLDVVGPFYTEEARLMPPRSKVLEGRTAASGFWRGVAKRFASAVFTTVDLKDLGDIARRETGTYAMESADGGRIDGKYVFVWLLVEGEWQIETSIWNRNGEPGGAGRRPGQGQAQGQGQRQGAGGGGQGGGYRQGGRPSFQGGGGAGRQGPGGRPTEGPGEGGRYDGNAGPYSDPKL